MTAHSPIIVRVARRVQRWLVRQLVGDDYWRTRKIARAAARDANSAVLDCASCGQPCPADRLHAMHSAIVLRDRVAVLERAARPFWLVPERVVVILLVIVSLAILVALLVPAPRIDATITAKLDRLVCGFETTSSDGGSADQVASWDPIDLRLGALPCTRIDVFGVAPSRQAGQTDRPGPEKPRQIAFVPTRGPISVSTLKIPRGRLLDLAVTDKTLTITVSADTKPSGRPPTGGNVFQRNDRLRLTLSAGDPVTVDDSEREEVMVEPVADDRFQWEATEYLSGSGVTIRCEFTPGSLPVEIPLELVGMDLAAFNLAETDPHSQGGKPKSFVLGGVLGFPRHDIPARELAWREIISLTPDEGEIRSGQLLRSAIVPLYGHLSAEQRAASGLTALCFDIVWRGETSHLNIGREGRRADVMPRLLFVAAANKQTIYVAGFAIYGGLIVYSLLFRSRPSSMEVADASGII